MDTVRAQRSSIDREQIVRTKKVTVWCLGLPTTRPFGGLLGEIDIENRSRSLEKP
jgi:hypothetical protein